MRRVSRRERGRREQVLFFAGIKAGREREGVLGTVITNPLTSRFPWPSSTLCLEPLALGRDDVLRHDMRLTTNHKDGDTHLLPRGT